MYNYILCSVLAFTVVCFCCRRMRRLAQAAPGWWPHPLWQQQGLSWQWIRRSLVNSHYSYTSINFFLEYMYIHTLSLQKLRGDIWFVQPWSGFQRARQARSWMDYHGGFDSSNCESGTISALLQVLHRLGVWSSWNWKMNHSFLLAAVALLLFCNVWKGMQLVKKIIVIVWKRASWWA